MDVSAGHISSLFQIFEKYLRMEIDLVQKEINMVSNYYKPKIITCESQPGLHTFKDLSEIFLKNLLFDFEGINNTVDIECDDISMITRLVEKPGIIDRRFDEKSISVLP